MTHPPTARDRFIRLGKNLARNTLVLLCSLWLLSAYEFLVLGIGHRLPEGSATLFSVAMLNDLLFVLVVSAIFLLPYLLIGWFRPQVSEWIFAIVAAAVLLASAGLIQYFTTTNVPLGTDLFGYSWADITTTVRSSAGFSVWTLIPFVAVAASFVWGWRIFRRLIIPDVVVVPFFLLVMASCVVSPPSPQRFGSEAAYNLAVDKAEFFFQDVVKQTYERLTSTGSFVGNEYPLYHTIRYNDVLGPFFHTGKTPPNLVFVMVEGLGRDFVGPRAPYGGFTPFLDSLTTQSLYWENFLSTTGRTFGILPSLFASLPYGQNGFMDMADSMPSHSSLIKLLKERGYFTSFYYGGNANFDFQDVFLDRQGIDYLLDQTEFNDGFTKSKAGNDGFSWGYADGDLFKRSLDAVRTNNASPRLDIYMTLSSHEPFSPPDESSYLKRVDDLLPTVPLSEARKNVVRVYKNVFATLLYVDDALRYFIDEYRKRDDYANTIFFITGDHRLIPIPEDFATDRYHVPFIIYSPMVKHPMLFSSVSSHADVTPSVLAFLQKNYGMEFPTKAQWLGSGIDTTQQFRVAHSLPLMRTKGNLNDYVFHDYFLSGERLFRLLPGLAAADVSNDSIKSILQDQLHTFKMVNQYVCENNKILPTARRRRRIATSAHEDSLFAAISARHLNTDQEFLLARQLAFKGNYVDARFICKRILRVSPNYHDVRMLLGRTYAWDGQYDVARSFFNEVAHRAPDYDDSFNGLIDIDTWEGNFSAALNILDSAIVRFPKNEEFLMKKARLLKRIGKSREALAVVSRLRAIDPKNEDAVTLWKALTQ